MTRNDYEKFASLLGKVLADCEYKAPVARKAVGCVITGMALILAEDNRNFDKDMFFSACISKMKKELT